MTPMLEMAQEHFHEIPEVLYVYNQHRAQKEDREDQYVSEKYIRTLDPYPPLPKLGIAVCGESFL